MDYQFDYSLPSDEENSEAEGDDYQIPDEDDFVNYNDIHHINDESFFNYNDVFDVSNNTDKAISLTITIHLQLKEKFWNGQMTRLGLKN